MKVELQNLSHPDPELHIGQMAAECYDSDLGEAASRRRAKHCVKSGHLATLRFASATFRISGISRACSHQLVRVAHAGVLQRSQRYVLESNIEFVDPPALAGMPEHIKAAWCLLQAHTADLYDMAVKHGMNKGDARYILPQGCTTSLNITGNFQMWRDLLRNRTDTAAQWEIRAVALEIQRQLNGVAPNIFPIDG